MRVARLEGPVILDRAAVRARPGPGTQVAAAEAQLLRGRLRVELVAAPVPILPMA
jgi:hypothetical protein